LRQRIIGVGKSKDIREAVEAELAFDPLVDAEDIDPAWMASGVHDVRDVLTVTG
jgi:hypothetical protein